MNSFGLLTSCARPWRYSLLSTLVVRTEASFDIACWHGLLPIDLVFCTFVQFVASNIAWLVLIEFANKLSGYVDYCILSRKCYSTLENWLYRIWSEWIMRCLMRSFQRHWMTVRRGCNRMEWHRLPATHANQQWSTFLQPHCARGTNRHFDCIRVEKSWLRTAKSEVQGQGQAHTDAKLRQNQLI